MKGLIFLTGVLTFVASQCLAQLAYWPDNGHYYLPVYVEQGISWSEARVEAKWAGGYLATPTCEQENNFVFHLVDESKYWHDFGEFNNHGPWLGGYQTESAAEPDGGWVWVDGNELTFSPWLVGEPSGMWGTDNENRLQYSALNGHRTPTWNDLIDALPSHYAVYGYIIEFDSCPASQGDLVLIRPEMDIQTAIDAAQSGDTLILMPGSYDIDTPLDFKGKSITLTGTQLDDPNVVRETELVCLHPRGSKGMRAFQFVCGEDPNTVLCGLTIRGGRGPLAEIDPLESERSVGGAVLCLSSSPRICHCVFMDNEAELGGAVYTQDSQLILEDCLFIDNQATGSEGSAGGAIYLDQSTAVISRCRFEGNSAHPTIPDDPAVPGTGGGAICCTNGSDANIIDCCFKLNESTDDAGAICSQASSPSIQGCNFIENQAADSGGSIYIAYQSSARIGQCLFAGNRAVFGGGLFHRDDLWVAIENCTFTGNRGTIGGAIRSSAQSRGSLINSVLYKNEASTGPGIAVYKTGRMQVSYCNTQATWGDTNLQTDPLFALDGYWDANDTPDDPLDDLWINGDYHLQSSAGRWDPKVQTWVADDQSSPCIDVGDPNTPVTFEPDPNGYRINMGAYGGTEQASMSPSS